MRRSGSASYRGVEEETVHRISAVVVGPVDPTAEGHGTPGEWCTPCCPCCGGPGGPRMPIPPDHPGGGGAPDGAGPLVGLLTNYVNSK
jgi:hypothetical protein